MMGLEIIGVVLVGVSIVYAFYKKKDKLALGLVIVLLILMYLLGYLN